jgi:hypothetical protein
MFKETHTIPYIQQVSHEWIKGDEEEITYTQAIENLRVVLLTFNTDQRFYRSSKQPTSPWSKPCLVLRTWRAMANQLI